MLIPEYTITLKILDNVSSIEFAKAIVENTTILPIWEEKLEKEADIQIINGLSKLENYNIPEKQIKSDIEGISQSLPLEVRNIIRALYKIKDQSVKQEINEDVLKDINKELSIKGSYRNTKKDDKPNPEEILANIVQLFDWYNSLDSLETHPIIRSAIVMAYLEYIEPFEKFNRITSCLISLLSLRSTGYGYKNWLSISDYYYNTIKEYERRIKSLIDFDLDLTEWIAYYTEALSSKTSGLQEKVKLLAKDTKIAKATGRIRISKRQENIVEYLQDYGILRNQDFEKIFPNISEDTVLRDLKKLIDKDIIVKKGKTKASRYELV